MATNVLRGADLVNIAASAAEMLKARIARQSGGEAPIAGWQARFAPGRIGAPGSAVALRFFREYGGLDPVVEHQIVEGLVHAQSMGGATDGGWQILSHVGEPSVEGTAPTLECLIGASGPGVRDAINRAEAWLENARDGRGGWGSTRRNAPRVYPTCAALEALCKLAARDTAVVNAAVNWLASTQRPADGSWGPAPGEPGTVTHTAMAVRALVSAGVPAEAEAPWRGVAYLRRNWTPSPRAVQHEEYDFHVGPNPHRVTAVYDVDAEVVLALLAATRTGINTEMWNAAASWVQLNRDGTWWARDDGMLTLWTVVPRALASLRLARQMGPSTATAHWGRDTLAYTNGRSRWPVIRLALTARHRS